MNCFLRKISIDLILDLIFLFFLFPFTNIKWNMLTQGFQKFYENITDVPDAIF